MCGPTTTLHVASRLTSPSCRYTDTGYQHLLCLGIRAGPACANCMPEVQKQAESVGFLIACRQPQKEDCGIAADSLAEKWWACLQDPSRRSRDARLGPWDTVPSLAHAKSRRLGAWLAVSICWCVWEADLASIQERTSAASTAQRSCTNLLVPPRHAFRVRAQGPCGLVVRKLT